MPRRHARLALAAGLALAALAPARRALGEEKRVDLKAKEYAAWHGRLTKVRSPRAGCFTAKYPNTTWEPVPCGPLSKRRYNVGYDTDSYPQTGPLIGIMTGRFDDIQGLTGESSTSGGATTPNDYSLQLNTNNFNAQGAIVTMADGSNPCAAASTNCLGEQQFVYGNGTTGAIFIEYWLKGFYTKYKACPTGPSAPAGSPTYVYLPWGVVAGEDCVTNSVPTNVPGGVDITQLGAVRFTVTALPGALEEATLTVGPVSHRNSIVSILGLSQGWTAGEFNVFGNGSPAPFAVFNPGASLTVVDTLEDQNGAALPATCASGSFTSEQNNLNLACPCFPNGDGIFFTESNAANPVCACPSGASWSPASSSCVCPTGAVQDPTTRACSCPIPGQITDGGACHCPRGTVYDGDLERCVPAGPPCPSRCRWGCVPGQGAPRCLPPPQ